MNDANSEDHKSIALFTWYRLSDLEPGGHSGYLNFVDEDTKLGTRFHLNKYRAMETVPKAVLNKVNLNNSMKQVGVAVLVRRK